jgi:alcohol dehydrogenase class IV
MDALTQLIEPFTSCRANPATDALCRDGLRRVSGSLLRAFREGHDPEAREHMSVASLFGGLALANAGLGAVHGFAGPIGGMFRAPHGAVCAALLAPVMSANLAALRAHAPTHPALAKYDEVAILLTGEGNAPADAGVDWVRELCGELQIPGLAHHGITPADHAQLVEKAMLASSMKANPLSLTREELMGVLSQAQ